MRKRQLLHVLLPARLGPGHGVGWQRLGQGGGAVLGLAKGTGCVWGHQAAAEGTFVGRQEGQDVQLECGGQLRSRWRLAAAAARRADFHAEVCRRVFGTCGVPEKGQSQSTALRAACLSSGVVSSSKRTCRCTRVRESTRQSGLVSLEMHVSEGIRLCVRARQESSMLGNPRMDGQMDGAAQTGQLRTLESIVIFGHLYSSILLEAAALCSR